MVLKRCVNRILGLAEQSERENELAEALRLSEAILADFPLHPEARRLRARVWARTGRIGVAVGELRDLVSRNADDIEARLALSAVQMLHREYGDAVDHLTHVARVCHEEFRRASDSGDGNLNSDQESMDYSLGLKDLEANVASTRSAHASRRRRIG